MADTALLLQEGREMEEGHGRRRRGFTPTVEHPTAPHPPQVWCCQHPTSPTDISLGDDVILGD